MTLLNIKTVYIIGCALLVFLLLWLTHLMFVRRNTYRKYITISIAVGIYSILMYSIFLMVKGFSPETPVEELKKPHFYAVLFDGLYFIGTVWLSFSMMIFSVVYTNCSKKIKLILHNIFTPLCLIDSISLLVNAFTYHSFDLVLRPASDNFLHADFYWGNQFYFIHYVHLFLCYIMVAFAFVCFFVTILRSASLYRKKYVGILVAYVIVIIANFICYTFDWPIDCSVLLYAGIAGFICYYSTYAVPSELMKNTLMQINETTGDGLLYFDVSGLCIYANHVARRLFSSNAVFSKLNAEKYREVWDSSLVGELVSSVKGFDTFEVDGEEFQYEVIYQKVYEKNEEVGSYIQFIDKTEEIRNYQKDYYLATHDDLTGILNRTGFYEKVDELIKKEGTGSRLMVSCNIRDFKLINELFGDDVGDDVLKKLSSYFKKYSHAESVYARISDDRFALYVLKKHFEPESFLEYVKSIQRITESSIYRMHICVGIYEPQGRLESPQSMYDKTLLAAATVYDDYNRTFSYFDSTLMEKMLYEKNISDDFEKAIEKNQIKMFLQPIMNRNKDTIASEALCRWDHPMRGLLYPKDFLYVLEKSGNIFQLDEYIWEEAVKMLKVLNSRSKKEHYIGVNVSKKDFYYTDIYKTFTRLVDNYDINPKFLCIEVTETVIMADFKKSFELTEKLQKFGFTVAIDDFGNGYSSLNMLKDFKANMIKIDMALVKSAVDNPRSKIILEAIISMALSLGIQVVCEGVETQQQCELLEKAGCHFYQGNYFSKPMDINEFEKAYL